MRLCGRRAERDALVRHLEAAAEGRIQVAFVVGEAGIGKTCLLDETLEQARERGFQVCRGRAEELDRARPFGVLADALGCDRRAAEPDRAALGRLVTGEVGDSAAPSQFRVVESFVELVERMAARSPVLLALDDLHWADSTTLVAVRAIVRRLARSRILLVASHRPTPVGPDLRRLVDSCRDGGASVLPLEPLPPDTVAELAAEVTGSGPGPRLRAQLARAGGNPLFVLELVTALRELDALRPGDGGLDVDDVPVPATLRLTILRRLGGLSEGTLELLRLASILGSTVSPTDLALVARRPVARLLPALGEARAAGLLGESGEHLAFRHDLVREAVYTDLPLPVRRGLHHEAGQVLAAAGASAVRVATQLALGTAPGEAGAAEAVDWLRRAARDAGPRAPGVAADLLGRAVDLLEPTAAERDRLVVERVEALGWAGRQQDSEALARAVLARPHAPAVEGELRLHLSRALVIRARARDALAVIEETEEAALTEPERVQLQAMGAWARSGCGDLDGALAVAGSARERAERLGDEAAWCIAAAVQAIVGVYRGDVADAVALAAEVVRRADAGPAPDARRMTCHHTLAIALIEADRLAEATTAIERFRGAAEAAGGTWSVPRLFHASTTRRFASGEWDEAIAESETLLDMDVAAGSIIVPVVHSKLAMIRVHRAEPAAAEHHLAEAERTLREAGRHPRTSWVAWSRGTLCQARGQVGPALEAFEDSWADATGLGVHAEYVRLGPELVRLALDADRRPRAVAVTEAVEEVAARMGTPGAEAAALRCRGRLTGDSEVLLRAVAAARVAGRPLDQGSTCEQAAALLAADGRLDEARELFDEAERAYKGLGARHDLDRMTATMRSLGIRRGRRGPRARPATGWGSLTDTELRVAALAAEGLTNSRIGDRLFVSHHTVATHLGHIFAKLGVGSRAELAAEVARRG